MQEIFVVSKPELLPCPFCGNRENLHAMGTVQVWIHCFRCMTDGPKFNKTHPIKTNLSPREEREYFASLAWNRRSDTASIWKSGYCSYNIHPKVVSVRNERGVV